MVANKETRAAREKFVEEHKDRIHYLLFEYGQSMYLDIHLFVNDYVRPELGYSDRTNSRDIWQWIRKTYKKLYS